MQYAVGEQVDAEKTPFAWYRGTVEAARGDSYVIRFDPAVHGQRSDLRELSPGKVRTAGAQLSMSLPSGSPLRLRSSSPSPRHELLSPHRSADLQQKYATLSEQSIRHRSERRKLEERLLACEHILGEVGPQAQMRRDEAVARLERRLDEMERTMHQELAVTQRRASDALAEVRRVSVASSPAYRGAAPGAAWPAAASQAARQLERRVAVLESSTAPSVCRELERKLAALAARVETQTLAASLSASPAVSRNATSAKAVEAVEARVAERLQATMVDFRNASLSEVAAVEQSLLSTLNQRLTDAAELSVRAFSDPESPQLHLLEQISLCALRSLRLPSRLNSLPPPVLSLTCPAVLVPVQAENIVRVEAGLAQACAADIEALQAQVEAAIGQLSDHPGSGRPVNTHAIPTAT